MWLFSKIQHWFSLQGKVSRGQYLLVGLGLILFKYAVEASTIGYVIGKFYSPADFFNPFLSARGQFTVDAPEWFGIAWVIWTIPFVWIAVTMSVRRCIDAAISPWAGLLVLVPILNLVAMLSFAIIRTDKTKREHKQRTQSKQPPLIDYSDDEHVREVIGFHAAAVGICIGFVYMFSIVVLSIHIFESYGAALFFGTPLVAGAATAYSYNRWVPRSLSSTIGLSVVSGAFFAGGLLLLGLEGMLCIAMAAPIMLPLGILGALIGRAIAIERLDIREKKDNGLLGCLLIVPLLVGIEAQLAPLPEYEVQTSIEIAATPAEVWHYVVDFPPITSPEPWYFSWGIASPREAQIDGKGVGAIRYCKFSTGEFVEPITIWEEPHILAFDVTDQPDPMHELSPYRHIHPPHLDGSFRSTRGEFRLIELPGGSTRLEGRTWYHLDMRPLNYWTIWTDALVHRIHLRVLEHIKQQVESANAS